MASAALTLAACGDGGEPDPTAAARPATPDPQSAARVEAICADGRTRGIRYQPPAPGESERDALTNAIQSNLLPALQEAIDEIEALGASEEQIPQIEPMLASMQEAVDAAEALDSPTLQEVERLFATSGQLARKAGLEACIYDDGSAGLG